MWQSDNADKTLILKRAYVPLLAYQIQLEEPASFCSRVKSLNLLSWHPSWSTSLTFTSKLEPNHPQDCAASQLRPAFSLDASLPGFSVLCRKSRQRGTQTACLLRSLRFCFCGCITNLSGVADKSQHGDWHTFLRWQTLSQYSLTQRYWKLSHSCASAYLQKHTWKADWKWMAPTALQCIFKKKWSPSYS